MNPTSDRRGPHMNANELKAAAADMRAMNVLSIYAAGSGHPGGTLSVMDLAAALYLNELNHEPSNPAWPERDRVFWSAGRRCTWRWEGPGIFRWMTWRCCGSSVRTSKGTPIG